jgi:dipeptidyl aminopeptidase/acylaminoacyl peptidase
VRPTDIAHLTTLGAPTLSPDGRFAVVAASRPHLDENEYRSHLWIVPTDGSAPPRRLTHGPRDSAPRYSPDGRWLAFLRTESEGKPQLHVLPADGGEARRLTDLPGGAGAPAWAPDSAAIAFSARVPEPGRYGQDKDVTAGKEPPRRVTGLQYRLDNIGFLIDQREHVFVVALGDPDAEATPRQVTDGDFEDSDVAWSPDGAWLAFISARHDRREHDLVRDVFVVRPDGAELRRLTDGSLGLRQPAFTSDGATVLALGGDPGAAGQWFAKNAGLFAIDVDAPGRPRRLTDEQSYHVDADRVLVDGDRAVVTAENRGAVDLLAVPLDGSAPAVLAAGRRQITGVDIAAGTTVVTFTDPAASGELAAVRDGELRVLSDFGARLRENVPPLPMTELNATAPDGYPVHGFLVVPDGDGPHPVLLMIHGGPFTQYGWTPFDEAQVYAGAGYAVVYGNPRGSSGYGQAHGEYIRGDVGERSTPDLLALLDAAVARPDLDGDRLGVLGGSHGGYMTTWLVGHSDRFRAAVSERAVNAVDSFVGSSDIGWIFAGDLYEADDFAEQRRQSPLTYADAINTPLLIIHSEQDWRCPLEQAQRLYVALRKRDATVEMLLMPGEGHEMSRSGLPSHRVARFNAILDWFDRYLR